MRVSARDAPIGENAFFVRRNETFYVFYFIFCPARVIYRQMRNHGGSVVEVVRAQASPLHEECVSAYMRWLRI